MAQRYDIERGPKGRWRVIDRFTGQVVEEAGIRFDNLSVEEADDVLDLLNRRDIRDRKARGID
jgi:hypothetical protein